MSTSRISARYGAPSVRKIGRASAPSGCGTNGRSGWYGDGVNAAGLAGGSTPLPFALVAHDIVAAIATRAATLLSRTMAPSCVRVLNKDNAGGWRIEQQPGPGEFCQGMSNAAMPRQRSLP